MPPGTATRVPIGDRQRAAALRASIYARSSAAPGSLGSTLIAITGEPRAPCRLTKIAARSPVVRVSGFRPPAGHRPKSGRTSDSAL